MSLVRLIAVWMTNHPPSVLWHCWLGHQTCKTSSKCPCFTRNHFRWNFIVILTTSQQFDHLQTCLTNNTCTCTLRAIKTRHFYFLDNSDKCYENRSIFARVITEINVSRFLWPTVYIRVVVQIWWLLDNLRCYCHLVSSSFAIVL